MERLTHERSTASRRATGAQPQEVLIQKLAAYENTGYGADEIRAAIEQAAKNSGNQDRDHHGRVHRRSDEGHAREVWHGRQRKERRNPMNEQNQRDSIMSIAPRRLRGARRL